MTREEAKKNLVAYMYYAIDDLPKDVGKALDMAIKALEQEPSGDLISRQAVKEWLWDNAIYGYDRFIDKLPSVNPQEPKTGHREYNDIYDHYLCGNCKTIVMDYDNFCPNCGAKMVEQKESEE